MAICSMVPKKFKTVHQFSSNSKNVKHSNKKKNTLENIISILLHLRKKNPNMCKCFQSTLVQVTADHGASCLAPQTGHDSRFVVYVNQRQKNIKFLSYNTVTCVKKEIVAVFFSSRRNTHTQICTPFHWYCDNYWSHQSFNPVFRATVKCVRDASRKK